MKIWYYRVGMLIGIYIFYKIITTDWATLKFMSIIWWVKHKKRKKK